MSSQNELERVSRLIDDMLTVREIVPVEKHALIREELRKHGKTLYEKENVSIRVMWCRKPKNPQKKPAMGAWLLAISAPIGTKVRFGDLKIGDNLVIIPCRIPMADLWIESITLDRGEWFEPIFDIPNSKIPVIFELRVNETDIKLRF